MVGAVSSVTMVEHEPVTLPEAPAHVTETDVVPRPYGLPGSHDTVVEPPPGSVQLATAAQEIVAAHDSASAETDGVRQVTVGPTL